MSLDYGSVTLTPQGDWHITCEPYVRSRLKRVFPRAPQHGSESLTISATPENSRDLLWFLDRYPMAVDHRGRMERLAAEHCETERQIALFREGYRPPLGIELAVPPREYQVEAAALLDIVPGYLLGDDLGLGKTVSAICAMCSEGHLPVLVVCPAHLPRQWAAMIARFAPKFSTHILRKGQPYEFKGGMPDVIISSYHKLRGWSTTLAGAVKLVVFDECQQLRSSGSDIYRAANRVAAAATKRLGLSATPIYNYGHEFFHVLNVLRPGVLGDYSEFIREWCTPMPGGKARLSDPEEFGSFLRREAIMLRRTRRDVDRELPELSKIVHEVDANEQALAELKGDAVALARIVLGANEQYRGQKMHAAGEFDAMVRQATGIAKAPYVCQFVDLLLDSGEPIVLFGWHRAVYAMWMEALAKHNPVLYTGSESATQKAQSIADFIEGRSKLLIMSLRSGAGVDGLQGTCSNVVFGELDWSPGVHEQCVGRVHRDGQDAPCTAYFLVADSGADPIIAEVLGVKREQIEGVRNPDSAVAERIDTGVNNIQRLAREFLERRGEAIELPNDVLPFQSAGNPHIEDAREHD